MLAVDTAGYGAVMQRTSRITGEGFVRKKEACMVVTKIKDLYCKNIKIYFIYLQRRMIECHVGRAAEPRQQRFSSTKGCLERSCRPIVSLDLVCSFVGIAIT